MRLRFGLRSFLLFTAVVGITLALECKRVQQRIHWDELSKSIIRGEANRGELRFRYQKHQSPIARFLTGNKNHWSPVELTIAEVQHPQRFPRDRSATSMLLPSLKQIKSIETLKIRGTGKAPVTDDVVEIVCSFHHLRKLTVELTEISDEGLARIRNALPRCDVQRSLADAVVAGWKRLPPLPPSIEVWYTSRPTWSQTVLRSTHGHLAIGATMHHIVTPAVSWLYLERTECGFDGTGTARTVQSWHLRRRESRRRLTATYSGGFGASHAVRSSASVNTLNHPRPVSVMSVAPFRHYRLYKRHHDVKVLDRVESVRGVACRVVTSRGITAWCDPQRDWIVCKIQSSDGITQLDYERNDIFGWLPTSWTIETRNSWTGISRRDSFEMTALRVEPRYAEHQLRVNFPPGTIVTVNGDERYQINDDGSHQQLEPMSRMFQRLRERQ